PDLRPQPGTPEDHAAFADRVRGELEKTRAMLAEHALTNGDLPSDDDWERALEHLDALRNTPAESGGQRIRVHGDYHLGQTLLADGELYLLDFEGEPARSLEERRRRDYALRDVASMLRSLDYAAHAPLVQREAYEG